VPGTHRLQFAERLRNSSYTPTGGMLRQPACPGGRYVGDEEFDQEGACGDADYGSLSRSDGRASPAAWFRLTWL
jgi:hypothetical protein